ncbi:unnamed protein product [Diabrotica balteata]|uniref:Ig-like domain-containing protein n=1 Tax=Diabrotica balteata TaxID=107213 RepID=A0A9N9XID1_DIABA|nr:unnamed protein product [Diabrotica balteata]
MAFNVLNVSFKTVVLPHITPFTFEEEANSGDMAQVSCSVSKGDAPLTFAWIFNGSPISKQTGVTVTTLGKRSSVLNIESVDGTYAGNYSCLVTNRAGISSYTAELLVKVLPHVTPFAFEEEGNSGDTMQVSCIASKGDSPMTFAWMFNGTPLPKQQKGISITTVGRRSSVLSIEAVEGTHAGNYTCLVTNRAGISSYSAELLVKVLPHVTPFAFEEEANSGDTIQVSCTASKGDSPMTFAWMFNGNPLIKQQKGISVTTVGRRGSVLSIDAVEGSHAGNYTCLVTNRAGISSYSAELLVKVLPHVTPFAFEEETNSGDAIQVSCTASKGDLPMTFAWIFNGTPLLKQQKGISVTTVGKRGSVLSIDAVEEEVNSGDMAQVSCSISKGDTPMTFAWMFRGVPIKQAKGINIGSFGSRSSVLNIESVSWQNAGNYTCLVSNRAGISSHSAELLVKVLPHVTPFAFEDEANSGDTVQVSCTASKGDSPMTFAWMFNGVPITKNKGINIGTFGSRSSVLNIESVTWQNAGNYSCVVTNRAGISSQSAELLVKGI